MRVRAWQWAFVVLAAAPMTLGLGYALLYSLGIVGRLNSGLTLQHWQEVLGGTELLTSLLFSLAVALVSIAISAVLSLLLVSWLGERLQRGVWSLAGYLPLAFPAVVVAFLGFQWLSGAGLLSRMAWQLGLIEDIEGFPILINDGWGVGIVAAHVFMATPFLLVYFGALYRNERLAELVRLAQTLGLESRAILWRVTLPVLLWRGRSTLLLYGMFVVGSYEIPLLLGSQHPQMLSVLVVRKLSRFSLADIPQGYVIVVCYAVLVLGVLSWALLRRR